MIGNEIIVSAPDPAPRGTYLEGKINGAVLPGTIMQVKAGSTPDSTGRLEYEVYNASADGEQRPIIVLLNVPELGQGVNDAYVSGARGKLYMPVPSELLNVRVAAPGTGTGDATAVGDLFIVDDGTGVLIDTTGGPESEPFQCEDAVSDVVNSAAGGTLVGCRFTGY